MEDMKLGARMCGRNVENFLIQNFEFFTSIRRMFFGVYIKTSCVPWFCFGNGGFAYPVCGLSVVFLDWLK